MKNYLTTLLLLAVVKAYRPIEGTNPWHKDLAEILEDADELPYPVDYFVPNFGMDEDIKRVDALARAASGYEAWKFVPKDKRPKPHPTDYVVPDFGEDQDIIATQASIVSTEEKLKKKFNPVQDENGVWLVPGAHETWFGNEFNDPGTYA